MTPLRKRMTEDLEIRNYLVETHDGDQKVFGATRESNAYQIISNALRLHGMDWGDIVNRARRKGKPYPTIELMDATGYGDEQNRFEFECGTFLVIADGPYDFDEVLAKKRLEMPATYDIDQELAAWGKSVELNSDS